MTRRTPIPDLAFARERSTAAKTELETMPKMTGGRVAEDTLWACTTCGACQEVCPVFIEHPLKILQMRQNLVLEQEKTPGELQRTYRNIERQSNPWGIANDERMEWAKDLDVPTIEDNPDPEYILWVGCAGAFDSRIKKQTRAMVKMLQTRGHRLRGARSQEACTGDPARRTGNEMLFQMLAEQNVETLKAANAKKVVTSCPHCLHTLRHDYPQFGGDFEVIHHTQLIDHLYKTGKLASGAQSALGLVTYHDSCYLGRWNREFDAPRNVIEAAGVTEVIELTRNKRHGFCCGAGGGRMFMEEDEHQRVNFNRADEIIATERRSSRGRLPVLQHHADRRHEAAQRRRQDRGATTSPRSSRRPCPTCRSTGWFARRTVYDFALDDSLAVVVPGRGRVWWNGGALGVRRGRRAHRLSRRRSHARGGLLAARRLRRDSGTIDRGQQCIRLRPMHRSDRRPRRRGGGARDRLHRRLDVRRAQGRRLTGSTERRPDPLLLDRGAELVRAVVVVGVALAVLIGAGRAHAQPADVPGLIKLITDQPADMDRSTWKEKRRDAARKLAETKDKRATPVLTKLAESETFDIIGEIAIEGLGTLGDQDAVPTLQRIAADSSRDKDQRDLARKALAKLGAAELPPGATGGGTTGGSGDTGTTGLDTGKPLDTGTTPLDTGSTGSDLTRSHGPTDLPPLPELPDDTLASYDRLQIAGGTAGLQYDTVRKELDFNADIAASLQRRVERTKLAWGYDAGGELVTGFINPEGRAQSRGAQLDVSGDGEGRYYLGDAYGIARAAVAVQMDYTAYIDGNNPGNDFKDTRFSADGEIAVGGGYGRQLDVGSAIRVRRLARALDANRALGRPIDAATAKKLQLTWWALRSERTTYRTLIATVAILREAGILLSEPDAGLTYEILNVLRDSWLYARPSGFDANLVFGEGYLQRPADPMIESGQYSQLLLSAGYATSIDDDKLQLSGNAYGRYRLLAPMGAPSPWALGATGELQRFTYAEHGDPIGAIDLTATLATSSDDIMGVDKGLSIGGQIGFTYFLNPASGIRLAGSLVEDGGNLFVGAQLQATYGLLEGSFAR